MAAPSLANGICASITAVLIVLIGMFMKRVGVLNHQDAVCLSKAIINLSTPALVVQVLANTKFEMELFVIPVAAIAYGLIMLLPNLYACRGQVPSSPPKRQRP